MDLTQRQVFTTGQVAKICHVASGTVAKWFDSGRLKGYRIPGSQDRRIPRGILLAFLKEHEMPLGVLEEDEDKAAEARVLGAAKRGELKDCRDAMDYEDAEANQ